MTNIYNYHLKCCIMANINWYQFFSNWLEQPNTIIELRSALQLIYPIEHEIGEREFRAWKAILKNVGCFDITPYEKDQSNVSNDLIRAARKHAHIYGPRELVTNKPVIKHEKMSLEGNKYIYQEDLGELWHICSQYSYEIFLDLTSLIQKHVVEHVIQELDDLYDHLLYYLAHQTRKAYLNAQLNANLLNLNEKTALIIVNYKIKTARETKQGWFSKKGWSLYSVLVYTTQSNLTKLRIQVFDHWSTDAHQDSWFTVSSLHAVIEILDLKPESVIIIWIFLEAGEVKTTIDSYHAQISYAINRFIRLGFDVIVGQDIENAIKGIKGTSVANLNPIRDRDSEWKIFIIAELDKCCKKDIHKPIPQVSTHTTPSSNWEMLMLNSSCLNPSRLTRESLVKELEKRVIGFNNKENKNQLINLLETQLAEDRRRQK
ncbi:hypothetical protein C2G38_2169971 [Gigaspora rosea]|uniref:Uncharacterized protein n=1 Tax=Gigaspora rosea TaxID=44941 RepID=A0A397VQ49_9GLOM|nr:hypothetical protein C2G38_2169971 [Gigaspora rosea]